MRELSSSFAAAPEVAARVPIYRHFYPGSVPGAGNFLVRSKNSIPLDIIGREFPRSPGVRFFMQTGLDPFRFVIIAVAGWMNQHQQHAIDYLLEENRVLRELI